MNQQILTKKQGDYNYSQGQHDQNYQVLSHHSSRELKLSSNERAGGDLMFNHHYERFGTQCSFSDRCSSDGPNFSGPGGPNHGDHRTFGPDDFDDTTFKIGRCGQTESDEDVRFYRDIEIRLKIEPLTLKLLQSITSKVRNHV